MAQCPADPRDPAGPRARGTRLLAGSCRGQGVTHIIQFLSVVDSSLEHGRLSQDCDYDRYGLYGIA